MKTLDPRVKLLCIMLCTSLAIAFKDIRFMAGLCLFTLLAAQLLGGNLPAFFQKLRRLVGVLASIVVLQAVFVRSGAPLLSINGFVLVTSGGALRGGLAVLRYAVIFACAAIMAGENSRRTIQSLTQCGMPYLFAFLLQIALRFLPVFAQSFSDAMVSIQLRGVRVKEVPARKRVGLYAHLLLPVVADAIQKSQNLSMSMQARGLGAFKKRTSYLVLRLRAADWAAMFALMLFFALTLWAYIVL